MSRLPPFDAAAASPAQRRAAERLAAEHDGQLRGPWAVVARVPEVAGPAHALYERLCRDTRLGKALFELMVLVVARRGGVQYAWAVHERLARAAGVADDAIAAIRGGGVPPSASDDERLVYDVTTEMLDSGRLGDATYARAQARFGDDLLVELVAGIGYYTMIGMLLNAFDVPAPRGERPPG